VYQVDAGWDDLCRYCSAMMRQTTLLSVFGVTAATTVTPVEKVISLLEDLVTESEEEGAAEAKTYDTFACFCKDNTDTKSTSILDGQDNIESLSATIQEKTATKEEKITEIGERKVRQEELAKTLEETKVRLAQERSEYEARNADLEKAISSLENAIAALDNAKPGAFLQVNFKSSLKHVFDMAEVMNLVKTPKQQKVIAFLQGASKVDPSDPEYKYHSQGILDVLNEVLGDFNAEKRDVDAEWEKTRTSEEDLIADTESQMEENELAISTLEGDVETLGTEIAQAREDLVDAESLLKDDQQYLKDLTERCEQRAHAYDQRSSMRGSELTALGKALDILENKVLNKDEAANERALLQTPSVAAVKSVSFLQQAMTARSKMTNLLQKARESESTDAEDRKTKALSMIAMAGTKLKSSVLMSLAMKAKADPFLKVKELIQKLIERLISEATAEATKKGFCDLELGKAEKNRNHRFADVKRLSAELASLNAKHEALTEELEQLASSLKELNAALEEATKLRADSKAENMQTLKDAKAGLTATSEALLILKVFYKQSAKGKVLLQASPIEEDDTGAESGAYKGNQDSAKAILGLLEVIVSDFQRTVSNTQAQEDSEQAEFIKFDRTSKADIGGKETKTELDEQDLAATETTITEKMKDLQTNQDLVDKALEELEELKPMCIDTGMSYEERVEKREEEIEALKGALCQLDPENVEPSCNTR